MEDEKIASLLAGQTALLSVLIEMLISAGVLERREMTNELYKLVGKALDANSAAVAPVRHLISLIEK